MPIERLIVECDCKKGLLTEIAETKREKTNSSCGAAIKSTIFYACNSCGDIYLRHREMSFPDTFPSFSPFEKYTGKLTKQQIVSEVPNVRAYFGDYEEKAILKNK